MENDLYSNDWEFGWGMYVVIIPLICTIIAEILKQNIYRIESWVYRLKLKLQRNSDKLEKIRSWVRRFSGK